MTHWRFPVAGWLVAGLILQSLGAACLLAQSRALELTNIDDATQGWVRILDDSAMESQTFTIEAWITPKGPGFGSTGGAVGAVIVGKPREGQGGNAITSFGLNWRPSTQTLRALVAHQLGSSATILTSNGVVPLNQMNHIAMSFDGTWLRLYINGRLDNEVQASSSVVDYEDDDILIGAGNFGGSSKRRFQGEIDDVRFWNHARSIEQITSLEACQLNGDEAGLLAYYSFDAGDATDDSVNSHDGTVDGMADFPMAVKLCPAFSDGFESGDTTAWTAALP